MQKQKITDCCAEPSCKCSEESDVSQQRIMRLTTRMNKYFALCILWK